MSTYKTKVAVREEEYQFSARRGSGQRRSVEVTTINQQHINRLGEGDTIIAVLSQVTTINQQHNNRLGEGDTIIAVLSQVPLRQNRQWAPRVSRRRGGERRPDCPKEEKPRWGQDFLNIGILL